MAKSSINVRAIKANSESHNQRKSELDYVVSERMKDNESFVLQSVADRLKEINRTCRQISGRKLQKNAIPIREAVVNLNENHTIDDIKRLSTAIKEKFGVEVFQAYIHRDEGHPDPTTGEFLVNHHAHLVFDWQDKETGKMRRLYRADMSKMQDLVAEELGMERGELKENSNRERLEAIEFKAEKAKELAEMYKRDADQMFKQYQETEKETAELLQEFEGKKTELLQELEQLEEKKSQSVNELSDLKADLTTLEQKEREELPKELETPLKRPKTTLLGGLMSRMRSKTSQTIQLIAQYLNLTKILTKSTEKRNNLKATLIDLQNEQSKTSKDRALNTEFKQSSPILDQAKARLIALENSLKNSNNSRNKGRDFGMGM